MSRWIFDKIRFFNRWKQKRYSRNGNWTIIGISQRRVNPSKTIVKLSLIGFDLLMIFKTKEK